MTKFIFILITLLISCVPKIKSLARTANDTTTESQNLLRLGIFYGYPQTLGAAAGDIAQYINSYDLFVLGDGLQDSKHAQHALLVEIMKSVRTKVFGYISIGRIKSWSQDELNQHIDDWKNKIGVKGIFIDEMDLSLAPNGMNMPKRMRTTMEKVRASGLEIFGNGPSPIDLFLEAGGLEETWKPGDFYLFENYGQKISSTGDFRKYRFNVDKLRRFSERLGIRVVCYQDTDLWPAGIEPQKLFLFLAYAAKMDGCAGVGATSLTKFEKPPTRFDWPEKFDSLQFIGEPVRNNEAHTVEHDSSLGRFAYDFVNQTFRIGEVTK